jgi:NodT family efflux transporter outer membrane factor (OMF) lipoprotein
MTPIDKIRHPGNGEAVIRDLREQAASHPTRSRLFARSLSSGWPKARPVGAAAGMTALLALAALSACAVGPNYKRPPVETPSAFKEAEGWAPAAPADALDRGDWWTLFGDPDLDALEPQVAQHNQTLRAAEEAYNNARALAAEARASFFPVLTANPSFTETGGGGRNRNIVGAGSGSIASNNTLRNYQLTAGATWAPDLWGKVRRQVEAAGATAEASAANVANVRLSMQTELASDYLQVRTLDEEIRLYDKSIQDYQLVLQVSQNQYKAGTAAQSAVDQAETQLYSAQAQRASLVQSRQQMEHAVAVLIGQPPAKFSIAPKPYDVKLPAVPVGVPSSLLERRPDIADAERTMKAANADIGVAVSAYFPDLILSGSEGYSSPYLGRLISADTNLWSFGASAATTIFQGGLRGAQVKAAKSTYREQVANYRQTVLVAFQQVEDQLIALRMLQEQVEMNRKASAAADDAEQITVNAYKAGTASSTDVVVAEQTALTQRRALITAEGQRLTATVALIEALGGGWNVSQLKGK